MTDITETETIAFYQAHGHKKMPILTVIKKHCKTCCCEEAVRTCFATNCHLFPYRLGKNPFNKRTMTEEAKQKAIKNLKGVNHDEQ